MNNQVVHSYCRLCAALCPVDNTVDLSKDPNKLEEVINKLLRFNLNYEWSDTWLPKTVCFSCETKLNSAFDFIVAVEYAQDDLNMIFLGHTTKKTCKVSSKSSNLKMETSLHNAQNSKDSKVLVKREADKASSKLKDNDGMIPMEYTMLSTNISSTSVNEVYTEPSEDSFDATLTWEEYIWSCKYCSEQYQTFDLLKNHSIESHNCCNSYRCTDCGVKKFSLNKFLKHVTRHKPYLKKCCYICLMTFPFAKDLNEHMLWHKKGKRRFGDHTCGGCNTMFPNPEELAKHIKIYFNTAAQKVTSPMVEKLGDYTNLKCLKCDKTFKEKYHLRKHIIASHVEKNTENICDKCGKCFLEKGNLIDHMQRHDELRPFQCEICKSMFKTKRQLRDHVRTHYPEKPFACEQCGRCFRLKKQLKAHKIIHTNILPHVCPFCDKAFRTDYRLKQHIRQHTGDKPFTCDVCKHAFTNRPNCYKHMKRIHNIEMAKKKRTPDGTFPVNPDTGEIIKAQQTTEILRWREEVLNPKRKGKSKINEKFETDLSLANLVHA